MEQTNAMSRCPGCLSVPGQKPLVSVIVPVYMRTELLKECLRSIRMQTMREFECVVVDDASPAGAEVAAAVAEGGDERFRLLRRERNGGPAAARNTGILATRGQYFMCVDEDDLLARNALERLYEEIRCSGADAVCPQARFFGGREGTRRAVEPTLEEMLGGMRLLPNGWLMKRSLIERIGGYDEEPALMGRDDWELWIRAIGAGAHVRVIEDQLYYYRYPSSREEVAQTLEHRARLNEVSFILYVLKKHKKLYGRHPAVRAKVLKRSIQFEQDRWFMEGFKLEVLVKGFWWVVLSRGWRERARSILKIARVTVQGGRPEF